jgi:hypothetical protein
MNARENIPAIEGVWTVTFFPGKRYQKSFLDCGGQGCGIISDDNVRLGIKGRLDTLQDAVVLAKLEVFDKKSFCGKRWRSLMAEPFKSGIKLNGHWPRV